MYLLAKILQATGLAVMCWGFIKNFPKLMPPNIFFVAALLFGFGWMVQAWMIKK